MRRGEFGIAPLERIQGFAIQGVAVRGFGNAIQFPGQCKTRTDRATFDL
jgi:hypothetical protein